MMKQLDKQEVQQHVMILGWLYIVANAIFLVIGAFVFLLLTGIGIAAGDPEAVAVLGVIGTSVGMLLALLGLPGMIAGYGLLTQKAWGRVLALIVGIIGLVNIPIGTIIGLYAVWVLMQESAIEYFHAPTYFDPV
ncbi:hypothetical protein KFU94_25430 [Chloroflexi bacterium TSY]|nr:hypothetical protein [Chloroflexi bacterium TSY]